MGARNRLDIACTVIKRMDVELPAARKGLQHIGLYDLAHACPNVEAEGGLFGSGDVKPSAFTEGVNVGRRVTLAAGEANGKGAPQTGVAADGGHEVMRDSHELEIARKDFARGEWEVIKEEDGLQDFGRDPCYRNARVVMSVHKSLEKPRLMVKSDLSALYIVKTGAEGLRRRVASTLRMTNVGGS